LYSGFIIKARVIHIYW